MGVYVFFHESIGGFSVSNFPLLLFVLIVSFGSVVWKGIEPIKTVPDVVSPGKWLSKWQ